MIKLLSRQISRGASEEERQDYVNVKEELSVLRSKGSIQMLDEFVFAIVTRLFCVCNFKNNTTRKGKCTNYVGLTNSLIPNVPKSNIGFFVF